MRALGECQHAIGRGCPDGVPALLVAFGDEFHRLQNLAKIGRLAGQVHRGHRTRTGDEQCAGLAVDSRSNFTGYLKSLLTIVRAAVDDGDLDLWLVTAEEAPRIGDPAETEPRGRSAGSKSLIRPDSDRAGGAIGAFARRD
jgi:hypothetical protein